MRLIGTMNGYNKKPVDLLVIVWCRKDIAAWITWDKVKKNWSYVLVVTVIGILACALASGEVTHYDTYLYHAQAIYWMEDYGVVPGLGNHAYAAGI